MEVPILTPTVISPPDQHKLQAQVSSLEERARAVVVTDQASADAAGAEIKALTELKKRIEEEFDPSVEAAHKLHRALCNQRTRFTEPVSNAIAIVKNTIGGWLAEQRRIADENARRVAEQARKEREERALAEAAEREKAGLATPDLDEAVRDAEFQAELAQEQAMAAAPVPKVAGVAQRQTWKVKVVDLRALIEYVAAHSGTEHYLEPNLQLLNSMAKQQKASMEIPGVKAYAESSLSNR